MARQKSHKICWIATKGLTISMDCLIRGIFSVLVFLYPLLASSARPLLHPAARSLDRSRALSNTTTTTTKTRASPDSPPVLDTLSDLACNIRFNIRANFYFLKRY
ncbi:hypothetical protein V8C34DRAFT_298803 [Trichoderma compactum]